MTYSDDQKKIEKRTIKRTCRKRYFHCKIRAEEMMRMRTDQFAKILNALHRERS